MHCDIVLDGPCDLENAKKSGASQDADAQRTDDVRLRQNYFDDAENHDETVEPIEHGAEVSLYAKRVHLDQHLDGEQRDEYNVDRVCAETIDRVRKGGKMSLFPNN